MPPDYDPKDLAVFRLHQAKECLQSAKIDVDTDDFKSAANRSYYCIFHAMRAVQALDGFDSRKHSGVIDNFRKDYIRTGVFPQKFSNIITTAFEVRLESDYEDFYVISKSKVTVQVENAKTLLDAVEKYVSERIKHP
jgi:uncharacterized protein (UPF0332 family)